MCHGWEGECKQQTFQELLTLNDLEEKDEAPVRFLVGHVLGIVAYAFCAVRSMCVHVLR